MSRGEGLAFTDKPGLQCPFYLRDLGQAIHNSAASFITKGGLRINNAL